MVISKVFTCAGFTGPDCQDLPHNWELPSHCYCLSVVLEQWKGHIFYQGFFVAIVLILRRDYPETNLDHIIQRDSLSSSTAST